MFLEKLLDFPDIGLSSFRSGDLRSRCRSNSGEFYGIRPYYSGDDIARVDWKKSTTGVLQIREYETDTDQSLLCIIQNDPTLFF